VVYDELLDIFRIECCPIYTPAALVALSFFNGGLFGVAEKIVALAVVDVTEMFDDAFVIRQCSLKLSTEASRLKELLFSLFDKLWGSVAAMHDAVASVAKKLETAEISDALAASLYLIVKNLMHVQVIAARLVRLPPITDFAKFWIAHHAQLFPNPRIENVMQCLMRQFCRAGVDGEFGRVHWGYRASAVLHALW
jgi:hypothetical protein